MTDAEAKAREWVDFATERPKVRGLYWFRIPGHKTAGTDACAEWVDEVDLCGMGTADSELWPLFSGWDGYRRSVPRGTQWRLAPPEAKRLDTKFVGLSLRTCPFCDVAPDVAWMHRSSYGGLLIGARPYQANCFKIECLHCRLAASPYYDNLGKAATAWNRRSPSSALAGTLTDRWRSIDSAPAGRIVILYFPATTGRNALREMVRVDYYPFSAPRKPTHWMPLPAPPETPRGVGDV